MNVKKLFSKIKEQETVKRNRLFQVIRRDELRVKIFIHNNNVVISQIQKEVQS